MWQSIRRLLWKRGAPSEAEIARELQDHLDLDAETLGGRGDVDSNEARFHATRRFGNVAAARESVRDVWRWEWIDHLAQDIRHGARALAKSPAYSIAVVVTLAMGIGAGTATYCLSRAIHDPFPRFSQRDLVWITQTSSACTPDCTEISGAAFTALRRRAPSLTPIGVLHWGTTLRTSDGSIALRGFRITPTGFGVLGAPFAAGHGFPSDAGLPGGARLVVLSFDFWTREFGARPSVIDSAITLGGDPYRVIGVLDRDVSFPMAADVYAPYAPPAGDATAYGSHVYDAFARLTPGATLAAAAAETRSVGAQLAEESPATDSGWKLNARPIVDYHTDDVAILETISRIAALLVFLAACMSAANLCLARLASRRHELALRTALGVRRWRLMRHLLTETLLLSLSASALGVALARAGVLGIRGAIPAGFAAFLPGWHRLDLDVGALVVALGCALVAVLAFGALPALRATRVDLTSVLSEGGRSNTGGVHSARSRATLIVLEVSSALVLMTAAVLLAHSVRNMVTGDAGVRIDHTLVMNLTLPRGTSDSAASAFYRELEVGLRSTPDVRTAGIATTTPLSNNFSGTIFRVPGRAPEPRGHELSAIDQHVTPGYLEAAGVRVVAGRGIAPQDVTDAQRVVVVSQMMADALWPHESALGRIVTIDSVPWTIVGVASDVHHGGLDEPLRYAFYRSLAQAPMSYGVVAVWTSGRPELAREAVHHVVARTNPSVAVGEMMTMEEMLARHVSPFAMMANMLGVLAAVTMTIAVVALYGLIAYGVARRTRELGVRVALGAQPRDILVHVAGGAVRLTLIALAIGIPGAAIFARLLVALLYRVTPGDPGTYAGVSVGLLFVALVAALIPSARAARVDPMLALRGD